MVDKSIENVIYGMEPSERQEQDVAWTAVPSSFHRRDLGYTHFATLAPIPPRSLGRMATEKRLQ